MKTLADKMTTGCACCSLNRRQFLAGCAAACSGGLAALNPGRAFAADEKGGKPKVRLVFTHIPSTGPIWPNIGYDFEKRKKELTEKLTAGCPGIELMPATVMNAQEAQKLLADSAGADGYIVYMLGLWTGGGPQTIAASGKPVLYVDDLYGGSGEFLITHAAARRAGQAVAGVSSSDMKDVIAAARCFEMIKQGKTPADFVAAANATWKKNVKRGDMKVKEDKVKIADPPEVMEKLKNSVMLVVGNPHQEMIKAIGEGFGTKVIPIDFKELDAAYDKADRDEATEWAEKWLKAAEKLVEPTREDMVKSGAMYLAEKELMKKYNAQGITINCLGGFYGGHIKAYPCLGFTQLNDDGLVGGCESDMISAISMLTLGYLTGRPSYISDPVIDTSRNQIIYAHCVAPTKVFGAKGPSNPFHIRSHSEDRKGAVVRSLLPLGYMTTTVGFHPLRKEVILHQGKAVDNIDEDKACRTKLAVEVKGDIDKLMNYWDQWGWHRVTVYGDVKEPVQEMARALKMKVVEEA